MDALGASMVSCKDPIPATTMLIEKKPGRDFEEPVEGLESRLSSATPEPNAAPSVVDTRFNTPQMPRTSMVSPHPHLRQP